MFTWLYCTPKRGWAAITDYVLTLRIFMNFKTLSNSILS